MYAAVKAFLNANHLKDECCCLYFGLTWHYYELWAHYSMAAFIVRDISRRRGRYILL